MTAVEQLQIAMYKVAQDKAVSLAPKALPTGVPAAGQAPKSSAPIKSNPIKTPNTQAPKFGNAVEQILKPGAGAGMDFKIKTPSGIAGARG